MAKGCVLRRQSRVECVLLFRRQVGVRHHLLCRRRAARWYRARSTASVVVAAIGGGNRNCWCRSPIDHAADARAVARMSFHPNDIARRTQLSSIILAIGFVALLGAFFRTQVVDHQNYATQSEENRLRAIPLPAPRGIIYARKRQIIAQHLPAYPLSLLPPH